VFARLGVFKRAQQGGDDLAVPALRRPECSRPDSRGPRGPDAAPGAARGRGSAAQGERRGVRDRPGVWRSGGFEVKASTQRRKEDAEVTEKTEIAKCKLPVPLRQCSLRDLRVSALRVW